MGFDQFPKVDRYSENENESNNYFNLHFSQKNGFLASKPVDKGCDFVVELIHRGASTNWRFSVQLKSIEDPTFIKTQTLLSYPFEVSRLRYLLEAVPPVSLILLYWPDRNALYYDFAEVIYKGILDRHDGNMAWKEQDKVNIHIPLSNIVDESNLSYIHSKILTQHQNSTDRSPSLYPNTTKYIHTSAIDSKQESDAITADLLKSHGLQMYFRNEIPKLTELIDQINLKFLREDSRLSIVAGLTYMAIGLYVDASFFIEKALNNGSITPEDKEHADWVKLYLDQSLGKISLQEYNNRVKQDLQKLLANDISGRLKYKLSLARNEIELLTPNGMNAYFEMINGYFVTEHEITAANLPTEIMISHRLQNVTNLGVLWIKSDYFLRSSFTQERKKNNEIDPILIREFESLAGKLTITVEQSFAHLKPIARNFVHNIMLAHCYESQVSIWLMLQLNALKFPIKRFEFHNEDHKNNLSLHIHCAKEALEIFTDRHFYLSAYNMSLMLLELFEFAVHSEIPVNLDKVDILSQAEALRQKLNLGPWELQLKALIEAHKSSHSE